MLLSEIKNDYHNQTKDILSQVDGTKFLKNGVTIADIEYKGDGALVKYSDGKELLVSTKEAKKLEKLKK